MSAEFDNFYENAGIVHLHNEEGFGDRESFFVIKYLLFLHSTLPADKPIIMMIHARGSTCFSYQAIIAIMDQIKASRIIVTVALGVAKSGGFIVLANGSKGYRYASPYSILMFHNVQISLDNNNRDLSNVRNKMEETDLLENIICINLAKNSISSADKIRELISKNCYLEPAKAKEMGFIDEIYDDKLPIAFPFFPAPIKQVNPDKQNNEVDYELINELSKPENGGLVATDYDANNAINNMVSKAAAKASPENIKQALNESTDEAGEAIDRLMGDKIKDWRKNPMDKITKEDICILHRIYEILYHQMKFAEEAYDKKTQDLFADQCAVIVKVINILSNPNNSNKSPSPTPWEDARKHNTNRW